MRLRLRILVPDRPRAPRDRALAWGCAAWLWIGALVALACAPARAQLAGDEAVVDLVAEPAGAGIGWLLSTERSPYRGDGQQHDLAPVYLYEGEHVFLRTDRLGWRFPRGEGSSIDLYLRRRAEGFPLDRVPASLQGLRPRGGGLDLGLTWRARIGDWQLHAGASQNIGNESRGQELSAGVFGDWTFGRWTLRPAATLAWHSSRFNDFYFGVSAAEATPERPAYRPGAGLDLGAGLYASYRLSEGWRVVAGVGALRRAAGVRASPIVGPGTTTGALLGGTYTLPEDKVRTELRSSPLLLRVLAGRAAQDRCNMVLIVTLRCTAIDEAAPTEVVGLTFGKTLVSDFRGWPLDLVGYVGFIVHRDQPFQRDGLEINAFLKAYYRGLPWRDRLQTRLGLGWGITVADPVPYAEVAEQAKRGRSTSRVLNYIDPSIDVSLGDLVGRADWKRTFVGLGITHRSGMFAHSRLLGNVVGGSNYIVFYVEHPL